MQINFQLTLNLFKIFYMQLQLMCNVFTYINEWMHAKKL